MRKAIALNAAVALGGLLMMSASLIAQATTSTTSTTTPLVGTVGSSCAPELIDVTGSVHVVQHTTQNSQGVMSQVFHLNVDGIGTGQVSGNQYVFTQTTHQVFNRRDDPSLEFTMTETIHVISSGGADDFRMRALLHVTINADGTVTTEVVKVERVCD
jgi:hypothetical protein